MRNVWLNRVDRALLSLGYNFGLINAFDDKEKEALIIDEYLHILKEDIADVLPFSIDDMADYILAFQQR